MNRYQQDHGFHVSDEAILRETIAFEANITGGSENPVHDAIGHRISLMIDILDFLKVTNR